jgi:plastocyanin
MLRRAALAAAAALLIASSSAYAAQKTVQMNNNFYDKANITIAMGDTVVWNNPAGTPSRDHTSNANLFSRWSEYVDNGTSSDPVLFNRAGVYAYHCTIHNSMKGSVKVKMSRTPSSGTDESTIFTIRVATGSAPTGFVQDVQMRKGNAAFAMFITLNNTTQTTTFNPTSPGRYQFRSRLRQVGGSATPYSPAVTINVT